MIEAHVELGRGGRVVLPAALRKPLGFEPGDRPLVRLDKNGVTIESRRAAVLAAQRMVLERVPEGEVLTERLLQMRRAENASG